MKQTCLFGRKKTMTLLGLSVMTLVGCDELTSLFDAKEVKTVRAAQAITVPAEGVNKSWDALLSHRAVCDKVSWRYERYGDADAVVYQCDFKDYDTQVLKAYSQRLLALGSLQKEVNDLKIELDEIDQEEKQMAELKIALSEMSANGLMEIYNTLADALGVGYVDYEALLKGQHLMKLLPKSETDEALAPEVQANYLELFNTKLNEVKAILVSHGIDVKSVQPLGLYRSALENSDYLRMKREDRDDYLAYDTALLKERRESVVNDIEYRLNAQREKESLTPPTVKELKQTIVFDFTPSAVKPIYCGITYTLDGEASAHTLDTNFVDCLRMSTAQTWNDDFTPLFNHMLPKGPLDLPASALPE